MNLEIILKPGSEIPIYLQIEEQIRSAIISGKLEPLSDLPSIRALAKMLRVSVITVQKAYEDLKKEGYIESAVGRGTIVAEVSSSTLRESRMKELEKLLTAAVQCSKECNLSYEDLIAVLKMIYFEEENL
ncbi:GntR family transcriptional regulator [Ileibacterium valens]|uniref:GntR family transcriptional regulator n=1 Tax=Ileibacterium valens TaxID=1862668 RepID=UPI00272D26AA|nr:GntR family transcriptional regulator [Ileibacterium valens]